MEIVLRSNFTREKIKIEQDVITLQTSCNRVLSNLKEDYNVSFINNKDLFFISKNVLEELNKFTKTVDLDLINKLLNIIGYNKTFLDRNINTLSTTEKIYLNILRNLVKDNDIIVFEDIYCGLDLNNQKIIKSMLNVLVNNNFTVIVCSKDPDILYSLGEYSIVASDEEIKFDKTDEIYSNVDLLKKLELDVPTLSYITYKAKKDKNVKLFYSKDVRDIIKDIYKHV